MIDQIGDILEGQRGLRSGAVEGTYPETSSRDNGVFAKSLVVVVSVGINICKR
jgi:hypothetical protein